MNLSPEKYHPAKGPLRLLLGLSIDAVGAARIPEVLAAAGLEVTVICPSGLAVVSSRFVHAHIATGRSPQEVRDALEAHVSALPDRYARVLIGDEPLQHTFLNRPVSPVLARVAPCVSDLQHLSRILSKVAFSEDANQVGLPIPAFRVVADPHQLTSADWKGVPFVIKLDKTMSGSGVHIIRRREDLDMARASLSGPFLVQDYISGRVGATSVLFQNGKPKCWFSYFLCRNWPNPVAASSAVEICWFPEIEGMLEKIGRITSFEGLCGIDWVLDPKSGHPLVLEMNPRPTPGMMVGFLAGVSFPAAIADALAGGSSIQRPAQVSVPMYRMFPQHLQWAIDAHRPWEFVRTWANAPWHDPKLLLSQFRRVVTHYLPRTWRDSAKSLLRRK